MNCKVVLVIDDEKHIYTCLETFFRDEIFIWESDGKNGIKAAKLLKDLIKVIFVDYDMPGINGLDTIKELRKKLENVPIIMISGNSEIETSALKAGADEFIEKPFEFNSIKKILERYG